MITSAGSDYCSGNDAVGVSWSQRRKIVAPAWVLISEHAWCFWKDSSHLDQLPSPFECPVAIFQSLTLSFACLMAFSYALLPAPQSNFPRNNSYKEAQCCSSLWCQRKNINDKKSRKHRKCPILDPNFYGINQKFNFFSAALFVLSLKSRYWLKCMVPN
jgi:hypothetical protein